MSVTFASLCWTLFTTVRDVLPIFLTVVFFQLAVLRQPLPHPRRTLTGFACVLLGIALFLKGLELALFPLGELMATQLTSPAFLAAHGLPANGHNIVWTDYYWIYWFAAMLGFSSALAEPSVLAVAVKAQDISGGAIRATGLRLAVACGSAIGNTIATLRVVLGLDIGQILAAAYIFVLLQALLAPRAIIGLAFDAGGVTTSTVTVPLVTALGLGLAATVPNRDPLVDGFGMIAFTCLFPIITVLGYGQIAALRFRLRRRRNTPRSGR